jgi:hypothetical protein
MNLPVEAITEFQNIFQRKFGINLTINEAGVKAENFLKLMILVGQQKNENVKVYGNQDKK